MVGMLRTAMSMAATALLLLVASCAPVAMVDAVGVRRLRSALHAQHPPKGAASVGAGYKRFKQSICADSACTDGDCTTTEVVQSACYFLTDSTQRTSTAFCRPGGFELVQHTFLWSPNCTGAYSTQVWQTGTCYPSSTDSFVEFTCEENYNAAAAAPLASARRRWRHDSGAAKRELPTPMDVNRQVVTTGGGSR